jgi:hypothetical protein
MRHCQNAGDQPITMTYKSAAGDVEGTFPGTIGGCTYKIPECRHADRVQEAYFASWNPDNGDWNEQGCLNHARNFYEDCRAPEFKAPVVATFHSTGKTQAWPSKEGGGCLIKIPAACPNQAWAGKTLVENRNEDSCLRRSREYFDACRPTGQSVWPVGFTAVTASDLAAETTVSYPGSYGGCTVEITGCTRDPARVGVVVENQSEERCATRPNDWWNHCGQDKAHPTVGRFKEGRRWAYPKPAVQLVEEGETGRF